MHPYTCHGKARIRIEGSKKDQNVGRPHQRPAYKTIRLIDKTTRVLLASFHLVGVSSAVHAFQRHLVDGLDDFLRLAPIRGVNPEKKKEPTEVGVF